MLLLPSCAAGVRGGPRAEVQRGDAIVQGEITGAVGMNRAHQAAVSVPVTFAGGARLRDGRAYTSLESGLELGYPLEDSPLGLRSSVRLGSSLGGPSGAYAGVRLGPMLALQRREVVRYGEAQLVPTLSLEGFANLGLGGQTEGVPTLGASVTFGYELMTSIDLRMRQGRPLPGGSGSVAPLRRGAAWRARAEVDLDGLDASARRRLGEAWLEDARAEHASIAAFAHLSLDLIALGAPPALLAQVQRAALDEIEHARLCFGIAAEYLGADLEPGRFELAATRPPPDRATHVNVAIASVTDGLLGEGLAARVASARARRARDPNVSRVLRRIARDEARHAALAGEVVRFCVGADPDSATPLLDLRSAAPPDLGERPDDDESEALGLPTSRMVRRARVSTERHALRVVAEIAAAASGASTSTTSPGSRARGLRQSTELLLPTRRGCDRDVVADRSHFRPLRASRVWDGCLGARGGMRGGGGSGCPFLPRPCVWQD